MKLLLGWDLFSKYKHIAFKFPRRVLISFLLSILALKGVELEVHAEVFYAQDEALKLAFPEADRIDKKVFVLTPEQHEKVEELSQSKLESDLFSFYYGYKGDTLLGYAAIDTHNVRTMPETFMVVFSAEGVQKKVIMLAFHEPPEYIASPRWLEQFQDKGLKDDLWPGRGVHGIVGSTLTSQAMAAGVRKILALYQILIGQAAIP